MARSVFVTVGSTSFDMLIKTVCTPEVLETLVSKGYQKVILQIGKGSYIPEKNSILELEWYTYKDNIAQDIQSSSLIISHAGAGSIMECLESQKPVVVVVNKLLMSNHQEELAKQLSEDRHLTYCNCWGLAQTLKNFNEHDRRIFLPPEPEKFMNFLNQTMGYR